MPKFVFTGDELAILIMRLAEFAAAIQTAP